MDPTTLLLQTLSGVAAGLLVALLTPLLQRLTRRRGSGRPEPVSRRARGLAIVRWGGLALLFAVLGGGLTFMLALRGYRLPDVTRLDQVQARVLLDRFCGLEACVTVSIEAGEHEAPIGTVVSTRPPAGTRVRHGSEVTLLVSRGPRLIAIPDVRGLTPIQGANQLARRELIPAGEAPLAYHNEIEAGRLIGSNPSAGSEVPPGSEVALRISNGPCPAQNPLLCLSSVPIETSIASRTLNATAFRTTEGLGGALTVPLEQFQIRDEILRPELVRPELLRPELPGGSP